MFIRLVAALVTIAAAAASLSSASPRNQSPRRLEDDFSWMNGYKVLYENCFHSDNVATFRFCPEGAGCSADCSGGGEYVLNLLTFVDAFTEMQMDAHSYRCEMARENCDNDDEDACYAEQGLENCDDHNENADGFNLQEYMECRELDDTVYYTAPYCAEDNYNIYLGLFSDQYCSELVEDPASVLGYELPYMSKSMIKHECEHCREHAADQDQNGGDDEEDEDNVIEQCEELYGYAGKCEENSYIENPDDSKCSYIQTLQAEESVTVGSARTGSSFTRRKLLLGLLIPLLALVMCCGCGYYCWKRSKQGDTVETKPAKQSLI